MQEYFYIIASVSLFLMYLTLAGIGASLSSISHNLYVIADRLTNEDK